MKLLMARFMLAFMLLWLPLQGYAVQNMTTCQKHHSQAEHVAAMAPQETCHGQHNPDHQVQLQIKTNLSCDDCSSCHLITQPALIVAPLLLVINGAKPPQSGAKVTFLPFFPEQPQHPPLASFS